MGERILALHRDPERQGANILRRRYDIVRHAILTAVAEHESLSFSELTEEVRRRIEPVFDGSVSWYVTTVKLDLEARGLLERIDGARPPALRSAAADRDASRLTDVYRHSVCAPFPAATER